MFADFLYRRALLASARKRTAALPVDPTGRALPPPLPLPPQEQHSRYWVRAFSCRSSDHSKFVCRHIIAVCSVVQNGWAPKRGTQLSLFSTASTWRARWLRCALFPSDGRAQGLRAAACCAVRWPATRFPARRSPFPARRCTTARSIGCTHQHHAHHPPPTTNHPRYRQPGHGTGRGRCTQRRQRSQRKHGRPNLQGRPPPRTCFIRVPAHNAEPPTGTVYVDAARVRRQCTGRPCAPPPPPRGPHACYVALGPVGVGCACSGDVDTCVVARGPLRWAMGVRVWRGGCLLPDASPQASLHLPCMQHT